LVGIESGSRMTQSNFAERKGALVLDLEGIQKTAGGGSNIKKKCFQTEGLYKGPAAEPGRLKKRRGGALMGEEDPSSKGERSRRLRGKRNKLVKGGKRAIGSRRNSPPELNRLQGTSIEQFNGGKGNRMWKKTVKVAERTNHRPRIKNRRSSKREGNAERGGRECEKQDWDDARSSTASVGRGKLGGTRKMAGKNLEKEEKKKRIKEGREGRKKEKGRCRRKKVFYHRERRYYKEKDAEGSGERE